MPLDVLSIMVIAAVTILLGYAGNAIFNKTKIPDVLWLLLFGLAIGPVLGIVDVSMFKAISPLLAAIALAFILFDAGLNMNFSQLVNQFPRSALMAGLNMAILIVALGLITKIFFGSFIIGALLGAIVSDTSSISVLSMLKNLKMESKSRVFLVAESVITDPLVIIVSLTIIDAMTLGTLGNPVSDIISSFSVGAMIGIVAGIAWLVVMDRLKGKPFDYVLTLSILLLVYVFVETSGGTGAVSALFFGIVLGNGGAFSRFLKLSKQYTVDKMVRSMQKEISFFISSFFFVLLGMIVALDSSSLVLGIAATIIVILARLAVSKPVLYRYDVPAFEKKLITHIAPRGLSAAVMAGIASSLALPGTENFVTVVFVVILATTIYASVAERMLIKRKEKAEDGMTKKDKEERKY